MPLLINDVEYFSVQEVMGQFGVTRQTIYRWRQDGKIPQGRRFRDRRLLFTRAEFEAVREFATRIEPVDIAKDQLKLFRGGQ